MSGTRETETTSELQNGETFNDEMKDYAKSTMNELLGMFGYEEEITREAVEELQIRLLPEEDEEHMQQGNDEPSTCKPTPADGNTPMAVDKHADKPPVVVQVEGCDSGSSTSSLPVSNGKGVVETCTPPLVAVPMPSAPQLAVAVEGVTTDPPSSTNKPATALDQTVGNDVCSSSDWTEKKGSNAQPSSSVCVTYTSSSNKTHIQNLGQCMWCKQTALLQDFSSSDGERRISCKGLCSALCFEKAVKNMKKSNTSPKETQKQLRVPQPGITKSDGNITKPAPEGSRSEGSPISSSPGSSSKKSSPTAPLTRSAARGFAASVGPQRNPNLFSWDDYLAKTGAEAAPWNCFKQSSTPPYNGFKCGMKLEVADPRIVDTMCVATVVGILGPRIRCRFDGTDSANDVWHLVDSKEIHPVGWCEGNGGRLQPPVGFKSDPGKYSTFLAKSLASAEMAPVRLFKREPTSPKANSFKTGMKLEALDPKNPLLICVATVADTDGDKIRVDFDGYLGSDYWCRFDSRDVFPVGWCYFSGHPLQPPGKTKKALKAVLSTKTKEKPDKQDKPDKTDKLAKQEKQEKPEKQDKKKTPPAPPPQFVPASTVTVPTLTPTITSPSSTSAAKQSSSPVQVDADDGSTSPTTVQVFINHSCHAGPYLNQAQVAGLPSCFRGSVANVARDCIQSVVNAALDPKVVFGFLKPGNGRTKIVARTGSKTLSCMLQHIDRVSIFWRVLEKFSDNLQCCENLFCGERMTGACPKCGRSASRRNTVLPETRVPANNSSPSGSLKRHHATDDKREGGKYSRINIDDDDVSSPQVCSSSHPKTWTVDEVVKFIESSELAEHSDMFRNHEIDGKALLLLTREMIMSYMGLKLGPAIKLLCFIDELKVQKGI